jgi:predicted small secreted protein
MKRVVVGLALALALTSRVLAACGSDDNGVVSRR